MHAGLKTADRHGTVNFPHCTGTHRNTTASVSKTVLARSRRVFGPFGVDFAPGARGGGRLFPTRHIGGFRPIMGFGLIKGSA